MTKTPKVLARRVAHVAEAWLVDVASRSTISSTLYTLITSRGARAEERAVLSGRARHAARHRYAQSTSPALRRNIHRLEKGLLMRERRPIFASAYIGRTVDEYVRMIATGRFEESEHMWARDVLSRYFEVVQDDAEIATARKSFNAAHQREPARSETTHIPVELGEKTPAVSFDDLMRLASARKSVRWFRSKPVDRGLIEAALSMAASSPSSCNRQSYRFVVFEDASAASATASEAGGTVGFAQNIPSLIVVIGDLSGYARDRDRHSIYVDSSLAAMQLMLGFEALGLSTCPINWPAVESRELRMRRRLDLARYERVIMLIAVGWGDPDGQVACSQRKPVSTLVEYR